MTYAQHARQYFEAGWSCVLPVPPAEKTPPPEGFTGEHGADVVPVDVRARWEQSKSHYSIALRMPAGVIAIDVDHYTKTKTLPTGEQVTIDKRGDDTLREHETRLGPLPATWASTARGTGTEPGPSRTLFYRAPPGRYATTLGDPTTCAVEILQRHHRYCVVWPSHHQGVGAPYRWYTPEGALANRVPCPGELAELPDAWVAALAQGASRSGAAAAPVGEGAVLLSVLLSDDWPECAEVTNIRLTACEEMASASAGSRHDTTSRRVFQLVRAGAFGHTGCGNALEELRQQWEALTSGENRGHEFDNMALSAARKAVTEVATTGLTAPAAYDPCLMMQVVLAPKPTQWVPDDTETPVLDIPAAAPPTVWSRRALIGTEAFDPRGLIDHKLAAASLVRMRPVLRYLTDTGSWVVREAHAWEINGKDQAAWAITELYELMPDGDPDSESEEAKNRAARKTKFGNAKTSGGIASKMHAMVYTSGHPCSMRASALDADPEILWAGRMAWDLRRCENRPQMALLASDTPHLHSAGVAPSGLGLEHPTPHWDAFLAAVWPDASIREWALHVLSVGLTGYSDAVLPLLMGPAGAGKTSTVNLVMSVLGSYGIAADPRLLVSADNTHASIVFALKGARLAFIDEAPRRGELATARLKQLTGGASMTGNPMRGNPITFSPTHTLVLTCNVEESPNFADPALRRRVRLIPCEGDTDAVAGARRAITRDVWTAEAPGVLAQLMHYAARWLAEPDTAAQYRAPDSIRWRAEDIAAEEDPVRQWIESEMEFCEHGTNSTLLRAWFAEWLRRIEPRAPLMSATMFGRKLTDLGYPAHKSGTKSRPLRRRQSSYGPPVPPPQRPHGGTRVTDLPPLVTRDDHQSSADADRGAPTGNDEPQTRQNTTDDHATKTAAESPYRVPPIMAKGTPCELCGYAEAKSRGYRDHCHAHGWIRGILCGTCNAIMATVDKGKTPANISTGLGLSVYQAYRHRCHECHKPTEESLVHNGAVQYKHPPIMEGTPCELCGDTSNTLIHDHCFTHRWIRGRLCYKCSSIMSETDRGKPPLSTLSSTGIPVDTYRAFRNQCHECRSTIVVDPPGSVNEELLRGRVTAHASNSHLNGSANQEVSTERSGSSPERPPSRSNEDQPDGRGGSHKQTDVEINLAGAKSDNTHDVSLDSVTKPLPSTKSTVRRECPEDQLMVLPAIISSNVDVKGQLDSYSPILATIGNDDLSSYKDHIVRIENKQGPNRPPSANDLNEALDQGEQHPRQLDRQLGAPSAPQTPETGVPLTDQQATAEDHLTQLRAQRNQLTKLIKKTPQDASLSAVYAFTRDQLVVSIKSAEKRLRSIRSEIAKRDSIAELGGDLLELPAHKTRHGPACSVTTEHAAEIVAAAIAHRADPGRLTVDIETTGYPIGHPDHAVRTVQLGNRDDGVVFDVADPVQFATCVTLLAGATELEAYSAAVEVSHLAHLGMIDYRDAWRRVHDVVIKAQLHNPVGTLSSDAGLKPQAAEHVPDAVIPAAEVARAQLFRTAGWTTDTKVKNSGSGESGGWVPLERSGWAQVDPRCRTQVSYAASDVLDCAALGETLPMPSAAVYERERAVQAAVGVVSYRGIALDRGHIETKIAEHTPQRNTARSALAALGINNPGSNDQIAAALLARGVTVGPNPGQLPLGTKSRKPSVAGDVLGKLRRTDDVAPLLDEVLRFREHSKALSTYLGPYHVLCTHGDGRVRTTIYTLQADTGRMSSVHPNLQNIPSHGGFRECFVADPGDLFIDADLFGIEVAVLAALSQDQVLLDLVASGRKLHKIIAAQVYGSNYSTRQYGYVKNGVFAKLYGAGVWRIANTVGCSEAEAQNMVDALDALAPGVKRWGYVMRDRVKDGMDSITLYSGRVLRLPKEFPHKIVNYLVQGTAREILADGILRWRNDTRWGDYGILVPVHDEILSSVPAADAPEAMRTLVDCMAGELYGVKIKAEPKWKQPMDRWLSNDHPMAKS